MRILLHSNAPHVGTGYGQQTALLAPLLVEAGHEVAISANYGTVGATQVWEGIKVYPGGAEAWGNDILAAHASHFFGDPKDGVVITLQDVWTLKAPELLNLNLASWVPVDHDPAPSAVIQYFRNIGARAIAMSRFGKQALKEYGIDAHYVPHSIDTEVFKPIDRSEARAALKQLCGVPEDGYLVGMVAANKGAQPPRKGFPEVFLAFEKFKRTHKDALLYLHTERYGDYQGCKLDIMADACGLKPEQDVFFPPQYLYRTGIPNVFVNACYNAFDVLVNPAYGEGFGVPIIEAQAAGCPVIVNNFTSMPELQGPGRMVDGEKFWDEAQMTFFKKPSIQQITNALTISHRHGDKPRAECREFALHYDHRAVFEREWKPVLADLEKDFFSAPDAKPVDLSVVK